MTFKLPFKITLIKDFDYCLFRSDSAFPTLDALFRAKVRELPGLRQHPENEATSFIWRNSPDAIVEHFGLLGEEASHFLDFYENLPVPEEAVLYPDTWQILEQLQVVGVKMFLVTKGEESFQRRKIAHVGIAHFFEEVIVVGNKTAAFKTKRDAFMDIVERHQLEASKTWAIGDGKEEIIAGRLCGHRTVQTLRPGVERLTEAHHHIETLHDLLPLLKL